MRLRAIVIYIPVEAIVIQVDQASLAVQVFEVGQVSVGQALKFPQAKKCETMYENGQALR